jgi:hypothetical protein
VDGQQQRWRRLNAAATVDEGVCAARVGRDGRVAGARRAAGGAERDTQRGRAWQHRRTRELAREARRRGSRGARWGVGVQWVRRQCRKQRRARGWPLSSIGRTTEACRAEGQRSGGRGSGRAVLRCGGRRRERCELWVRGTTRERKQFGPLLLPTHSSACLPHGTLEGAQKAPIVLEAFSLRQILRQAARCCELLGHPVRPPSAVASLSGSLPPGSPSCQKHIARCQACVPA